MGHTWVVHADSLCVQILQLKQTLWMYNFQGPSPAQYKKCVYTHIAGSKACRKARMSYVTIQVPFSSRDAMVGGSLQSTGRGQSGLGRRHWQAAAAEAARAQTQAGTGSQALSLRRACFDEGVAFPDKN